MYDKVELISRVYGLEEALFFSFLNQTNGSAFRKCSGAKLFSPPASPHVENQAGWALFRDLIKKNK